MKKLIAFLMLLPSLSAMANEKGNGGIVIKCGDKIELADFYETKLLPGLKRMNIKYSDDGVETQVMRALDTLGRAYGNRNAVMDEYSILERNIIWIDGQFSWDFTGDLGRFPRVEGCEPLNVINYFEGGYADAQKPLYDKLTKTEKAGLKVHEVVYKLTRKNGGQTNSLAARRITSLLFSEVVDENLLKGLVLKYMAPSEFNHLIDLDSRREIYVDLKETPLDFVGGDLEGYKELSWNGVLVSKKSRVGNSLQSSSDGLRLPVSGISEIQHLEIKLIVWTRIPSIKNKRFSWDLKVEIDGKKVNLPFDSSYFRGVTGYNNYVEKTMNLYFIPVAVDRYMAGRL